MPVTRHGTQVVLTRSADEPRETPALVGVTVAMTGTVVRTTRHGVVCIEAGPDVVTITEEIHQHLHTTNINNVTKSVRKNRSVDGRRLVPKICY